MSHGPKFSVTVLPHQSVPRSSSAQVTKRSELRGATIAGNLWADRATAQSSRCLMFLGEGCRIRVAMCGTRKLVIQIPNGGELLLYTY